MCIVGSCLTICVGEPIVKLALTHKYVCHLEPLQRDIVLIQSDCYCPWASWVLASQRSLSAQDPSQPKILVSPRSQSTQDPSQPKIPVSPRSQSALDSLMPTWLMPIWIMPIWYLAHAYLIFGSCLFDIWLMPIWFMAHAKPASTKFSNTYLDFSHSYLAHAHFSQCKKCMSQGPAVFFFLPWFAVAMLLLPIIIFSVTLLSSMTPIQLLKVGGSLTISLL